MIRGLLAAMALLAAVLGTNSARADTVYINAITGGETLFSNVCEEAGDACGPSGYETPIYQVQPGEVVDLGTLTLTPFVWSSAPEFGPPSPVTYEEFVPALLVSYGSVGQGIASPVTNGTYFCQSPPESCSIPSLQSATYQLTYTIPAGDYELQLAWGGYYEYLAAAVPESSTWVMLLIGFAAIGIAGFWNNRSPDRLIRTPPLRLRILAPKTA